MEIEYWLDLPDRLDGILNAWAAEHKGADFGISVIRENVETDIYSLTNGENSDVMVLTDENEPVGLMVLMAVPSWLGDQRIAIEKYWYVKSDHRTGGFMMVEEAKKWAKEHGCSHLVMIASNMASEMHDKVCAFYEHVGMKLFETSFISEV